MVAPMITAPHRVADLADSRIGTVHVVTDEEVAAGRYAGRHVAVLYAQMFPANLIAPERDPYALCDRCALR